MDEDKSINLNGSATQAEMLDSAAGTITLDALKLRLAALVAPITWRASIRKTAQGIELGTPLEESFSANRASMPGEFVSLFQEALHTRDPAGLLLEALLARNDVRQSWRDFAAIIVYPLCLFVFAVSVGVAFSFVMQSLSDTNWIDEFGLTGLEFIKNNIQDGHHAILGLGMLTAWVGLVLLSIAFAGPAWAWLAVVGGIVLIGRPLRWINLRELLCRFQLFIAQGLDTSAAAQAVARSFDRSGQAVVAKAIAARMADGSPLGKSIGESMLTDGLCRPALLMLDSRGHELPAALSETSELLGRLTEQRCRTLAAILPVFVLILVGSIVWVSISGYFFSLLPLISLITSLA